VRQRRAAERRAAESVSRAAAAPVSGETKDSIGPTEMTMPGSTGIALHPRAGHGHPQDMNAMTKGCLAGTGVCFISHRGEVYPCGYLPVLAGDLNQQSFAEIWENAEVFQQLRNTDNLKGKCGYCEFRNLCMGCRARAFAATGDYLDEEPFCVYQPRRSNSNRNCKELDHCHPEPFACHSDPAAAGEGSPQLQLNPVNHA